MRYIDVSEHQGIINWDFVKSAGQIDGVIIRAGYGQNNIDAQFVRNISECNRLGIPCGVFWFSYAYTPEMAKKEAEYCLQAIAPYKVELPVAFDFEYDSVNYLKRIGIDMTTKTATAMADAFLSHIEGAGYYAMLYTSPNFITMYYDMTELRNYDLWLAWYTTKDHYVKLYNPGIWQYASNGRLQGIESDVDMNTAFFNYAEIIRESGLNKIAEIEPNWYDEAQEWAKEHAISDGTRPEETTTRAEVWTMLHRLWKKLTGGDGS